MATIIDPILGVPSTILNIPSYQHEYTKTPVPYADLLPVPEPPRNMVYPDNAPPVLANLNAFYAGARQSQNVHTDGNHALLVSDVGGGGGVSTVKPTGWGFSSQHVNGSGVPGSISFGILPISILYYLYFSAVFVSDSFAPNDPQLFKLYFEQWSGGGPNFPVAGFVVNLPVAAPATPFTTSGVIALPVPVDLSFINGPVTYGLHCSTPGGPVGDITAMYWGA